MWQREETLNLMKFLHEEADKYNHHQDPQTFSLEKISKKYVEDGLTTREEKEIYNKAFFIVTKELEHIPVESVEDRLWIVCMYDVTISYKFFEELQKTNKIESYDPKNQELKIKLKGNLWKIWHRANHNYEDLKDELYTNWDNEESGPSQNATGEESMEEIMENGEEIEGNGSRKREVDLLNEENAKRIRLDEPLEQNDQPGTSEPIKGINAVKSPELETQAPESPLEADPNVDHIEVEEENDSSQPNGQKSQRIPENTIEEIIPAENIQFPPANQINWLNTIRKLADGRFQMLTNEMIAEKIGSPIDELIMEMTKKLVEIDDRMDVFTRLHILFLTKTPISEEFFEKTRNQFKVEIDESRIISNVTANNISLYLNKGGSFLRKSEVGIPRGSGNGSNPNHILDGPEDRIFNILEQISKESLHVCSDQQFFRRFGEAYPDQLVSEEEYGNFKESIETMNLSLFAKLKYLFITQTPITKQFRKQAKRYGLEVVENTRVISKCHVNVRVVMNRITGCSVEEEFENCDVVEKTVENRGKEVIIIDDESPASPECVIIEEVVKVDRREKEDVHIVENPGSDIQKDKADKKDTTKIIPTDPEPVAEKIVPGQKEHIEVQEEPESSGNNDKDQVTPSTSQKPVQEARDPMDLLINYLAEKSKETEEFLDFKTAIQDFGNDVLIDSEDAVEKVKAAILSDWDTKNNEEIRDRMIILYIFRIPVPNPDEMKERFVRSKIEFNDTMQLMGFSDKKLECEFGEPTKICIIAHIHSLINTIDHKKNFDWLFESYLSSRKAQKWRGPVDVEYLREKCREAYMWIPIQFKYHYIDRLKMLRIVGGNVQMKFIEFLEERGEVEITKKGQLKRYKEKDIVIELEEESDDE